MPLVWYTPVLSSGGSTLKQTRWYQKQNIRIRPISVLDPDHVTLMTQSQVLLPASNRRCRPQVTTGHHRSPQVTHRSPQVTHRSPTGHQRSPQVTTGHHRSPQVTTGHLEVTTGHQRSPRGRRAPPARWPATRPESHSWRGSAARPHWSAQEDPSTETWGQGTVGYS